MKNRLLAHATITRQHSGGGTMLAGAYVTRQHKWKHLCWRVSCVARRHYAFAKSTIPF
jgi:hypothetical protein